MPMIDLPADTVWPTPTLGVAIVQGDESYPLYQVYQHPQAWAQYDKPCETCGGSAHTCGCDGTWPTNPNHNRHCVLKRPCGCWDGRQVWTVRWPCPDDGTVQYLTERGRIERLAPFVPVIVCETCQGTGYLSARAKIQVVPVVEFADGLKPDVMAVVVKEHAEHAAVLWMGDGELFRLPLDPLPQPGRDWAVIVRPTDD